MIKGSIQEQDITLINIYAPNTGVPKYVKKILIDIKGEIDNNTVIVGDFNSSLTSMDKSSRKKINKETVVFSSKNRRKHILFKCTWDVLQDRSHAKPQNKIQQT